MYVKTIITYAGPAWGALISTANWRRLEAVQSIALRIITGSPWFVRNTVISKSSQVPSIQSTITQNSKNMFIKLQQFNYNHLQSIGKMIGPPELNRNRPGELTRRT
ncbi:unnamed protein product [Macrosiphum euphorbiae]|uniref:Uncharacterized protein n=1 Tax=Macrosiphum euphorbiae TaxID=13131 RepID=A0AAV0VZT2_9HEMI|nr:unnamed protein product [Macrosiphum euphorbiae]